MGSREARHGAAKQTCERGPEGPLRPREPARFIKGKKKKGPGHFFSFFSGYRFTHKVPADKQEVDAIIVLGDIKTKHTCASLTSSAATAALGG